MTKTLHSCSPEDSMDSALELMNRIKARSTHHYERIILMTVLMAVTERHYNRT